MITHIRGNIVEQAPDHVVIDCNGVGYLLNTTLNTFSKTQGQKDGMFYTHLAIREDAHTLYGFADKEERQYFRHLISVSGVGASTARMILSALTAAEVYQAIAENDVNKFKSVKGIGAKSAQRIIVDLKDKLQKEEFLGDISTSSRNTSREEALSALVALGFDRSSSGKLLDKITADKGVDVPVDQLVKEALKYL